MAPTDADNLPARSGARVVPRRPAASAGTLVRCIGRPPVKPSGRRGRVGGGSRASLRRFPCSGRPAVAARRQPADNIVRQHAIEAGDRHAMHEEAGDGLLEIPPVEAEPHGEFAAEAELDRTPHAVQRDRHGDHAQPPPCARALSRRMPNRPRAMPISIGQRKPRWTATMTRTPIGGERVNLPGGKDGGGGEKAGEVF